MKITMDKNTVLNKLYSNREKHRATYADAKLGWEVKMEEYSKQLAQWAKGGTDRPQEPHKPVNFMKEYDFLIEMIEAHREASIQLDEDDFKKIIKNEFSWSGYFATTNSAYTVVRD